MDKVIVKAEYTSKDNPFVSLKKYPIVDRGEKRYALLKWFNAKKSRLFRLRFTLVEYDDFGKICSKEYDLPVTVDGESFFGTSIFIRLNKKAKRIEVIVRNAEYPLVRYRIDGGVIKEEAVEPNEKNLLRLSKKGKPYIEERKFALSSAPKWALIAAFALILGMSFLIVTVL